ncbi:MAG: tetratricopeptide repeat protein [Promethearchaeota archaeon]|jgi:tetratricopeptide (TPR) repeat protein
MSDMEPKELDNAKEFIENGRFDEASIVLKDFGKKKDISHYEQISYYILMSLLSDKLKNGEKLLDYAEKAYLESQGQEDSLQLVDVYIVKSMAYFSAYKYEEALTLLVQSEKILESIHFVTSKEPLKRKAEISFRRANIYFMLRKFDKALEYAEETLLLNKKLDIKLGIVESLDVMKNIYHSLGEFDKSLEYLNQCLLRAKEIDYKAQILNCYINFGIIYAFRGEVDNAIEQYNNALAIAKEIDYRFGIAASLNNLGDLYRRQGHFNLAQKTLEKSLKIFKELGISGVTSLDCLFHLALEEGDLKLAETYLEQLKQIQHRSKFSSAAYHVDKAVFLKASPRSIHRGKAEEILKQVIEEEIVDYEITLIALLHLCDLLLSELQNTGDLGIIDEINPYIDKILDLAEKNHSYPLLAEVFIFRARLALVTLELKKARKLLTDAQNIADKYHINRLALKISTEHDELLKQLNKWEEIKESNTSLEERVKLASLHEQMHRMIHKGAIEPIEITHEEPVVLVVVSESGVPIFSQSFDVEWDFEDHLLGGFLSAINSFSDEMFAQGLDRATFGQYNLLMKLISPFMVCYLYKGSTYIASHRIRHFIEKIQKDPYVWETFNKFLKTSQLVELKDIPSIKPLINDLFIERSIQLDVFESSMG